MLPVSYMARRPWTVLLIFQSLMICIQGECGKPPVIEHTLPVAETSGVPGSTVVYRCDRSNGYYELPDKSRTIECQDDNTWSSVTEFCARACDVPERLDFAIPKDSDLTLAIYLRGTKVSYECIQGYIRVPRSTNVITCLENYTWSTPGVFCEPRSCGHPGDLENGDFNASNHFVFGSRVTYYCNDGYILANRRAYRDCLADGKWSNVVPVCEVVVCPAPVTPADGTYNPVKDEYNYLDAVSFKCNAGFHIDGSGSASCTKDGTWSDEAPKCIVVDCQDPGQLPNIRRASGFRGPYTLNSAVRFECEQGFVMNGSSLITCTINSQWQPEIPKCLTVCGTPPANPYAVLEEHFANLVYYDGTTVTYKCKPGYERNPDTSNNITCVGTHWSAFEDFCSPISCGDPGEVSNAKMLASPFTFGSKVFYKCEQGYEMMSIDHRECQANGTWSSGDIICSVACQRPVVANSTISDVKRVYLPNSVVTFQCQKGFVLSGSGSITCSSAGQWEPSPPTCNATCQFPNVTNSVVKSGLKMAAYMQNDVLVFECNKDYSLNGSSTITCSDKGQWKPPPPKCVSPPGPIIAIIIGIVIGCAVLLGAVGGMIWFGSKSKSGKSVSATPNVQYTACNDVRDKEDANA